MNSSYGFSDSGDEVTGSYSCSDPEHCDKGDECDGEHTYSCEYYRTLGGWSSQLSEDTSETVNGKSQSPSQPVVIDDDKSGDDKSGEDKSGEDKSGDDKSGEDKSGDDKSGDANPVQSGDNSREHKSDSGDDDHNSNSEDAQSCS